MPQPHVRAALERGSRCRRGQDPIPGANFRDDSFASLAVDQGTGAVYVDWADLRDGRGRIVVSRSSDQGSTWSTPTVVSPAADGYAFFQGLDVAANGRVDGGYQALQTTDTSTFGTGNATIESFYLQSTDGGTTWSASTDVSSVSSDPATSAQNGLTRQFWGDYNTLVSTNANAFFIYTDSRDGVGCPGGRRVPARDGADAGARHGLRSAVRQHRRVRLEDHALMAYRSCRQSGELASPPRPPTPPRKRGERPPKCERRPSPHVLESRSTGPIFRAFRLVAGTEPALPVPDEPEKRQRRTCGGRVKRRRLATRSERRGLGLPIGRGRHEQLGEVYESAVLETATGDSVEVLVDGLCPRRAWWWRLFRPRSR
jgi:hypothetical protein